MQAGYKNILFCLDGSGCSAAGVDVGLCIAAFDRARVAGCHVYAARLHGERFRQMEPGLPERYRNGPELERQRALHASLITDGLKMIASSYMSTLVERAARYGIEPVDVGREGKNYDELSKEAVEGGYDLVVIGADGIGKTGRGRVGSVCERVLRRVRTDVLVAKEFSLDRADGPIVAAVDGSASSFGAFLTALRLSKVLGRRLEVVSSFDPEFHYAAFRAIAGVLPAEAGRLFRFNEQERLHEEIIDQGLERIYRAHLETAVAVAKGAGVEAAARLVTGKAWVSVVDYAGRTGAFMLVLGRTGVHAAPGLDIGGTAENSVREAGCHVLVSSREFSPGRSAPGANGCLQS